MAAHTRNSRGFTLIEMLIVVVLIGILAAMTVASTAPSTHDQLRAAAEILAGDLDYARSLAVRNNSRYRVLFDVAQNRCILEHTGTNTSLETLPASPLRNPTDPADQQIARFDALPGLVPNLVRLAAVGLLGPPIQKVTDVEFGPLGECTRPQETCIWLAAGHGAATRYLKLRVDPVTGLTWTDPFTATGPPSGL
jgi:prepilin-type N-terminal cleavage/methylation domain-containing protein